MFQWFARLFGRLANVLKRSKREELKPGDLVTTTAALKLGNGATYPRGTTAKVVRISRQNSELSLHFPGAAKNCNVKSNLVKKL